jgi:predicted amidohydrolase YtcJ
VAAIERVAQRCLAVGVTSVHDLFVTNRGQLSALEAARDAGRLGIRFTPYLGWHLLDGLLDGSIGVAADDWLRIGGVKLISDGSIQGYTACLSAPYFDRPDATGVAVLSAEELVQLVGRTHAAGVQVAVHTNGDAAIDVALDAIERAIASGPPRDHRHRLEHVQTVREDQLDRLAAAQILPSVFVNHVYYWGDRHRDRFLGPERAARISPLRSIVDRGLPFGLHCDCPVTPVDPLFTMSAAVNRLTSGGHELGPEQRITAEEALRGYTSDAARFSFEEHAKGTVEAGKLADLVVLDADPCTVEPEAIADIPVRHTIVGGEIRYSR